MNATNPLIRLIKGLFPEVCAACEHELSHENLLCINCMYELPITDHLSMSPNRFTMHFLGRINLVHGAAFLEFYKEGMVQELLHKLKYRKKYYIGEFLGRMAGKKLLEPTLFQNINLIIPVPLHRRKQNIRGYNQSEAFAKGLSESTNIPYFTKILTKTTHTSSQTAKTRIERIENVASSFHVNYKENIEGKHILLVDDVITTGATLEACALSLLARYQKIKISMLAIAIAND